MEQAEGVDTQDIGTDVAQPQVEAPEWRTSIDELTARYDARIHDLVKQVTKLKEKVRTPEAGTSANTKAPEQGSPIDAYKLGRVLSDLPDVAQKEVEGAIEAGRSISDALALAEMLKRVGSEMGTKPAARAPTGVAANAAPVASPNLPSSVAAADRLMKHDKAEFDRLWSEYPDHMFELYNAAKKR